MSLTPSNMLPLGTQAPEFSLPDAVTGKDVKLQDVRGPRATLIMFICNHCPYVKHVNSELVRLAKDYQSRGVGMVAISSNDIENYPEDAPDKMRAVAETEGYPFPYLFDDSQAVARAYEAACTPDFYLFDDQLALVYRGRLDASTPGNDVPVSGEEMRAALEAVLAGEALSEAQQPSVGCNIKWKASD